MAGIIAMVLVGGLVSAAAYGVYFHARKAVLQLAACSGVFVLCAVLPLCLPTPWDMCASLVVLGMGGGALLVWCLLSAILGYMGRAHVPACTARLPRQLGRVLLVVPHPDDEFNIAGGILGALNDAGKLYVLFVTNGDINRYSTLPYREAKGFRMREAMRALRHCGVPRENIIFLGYGNEWQPGRRVGADVPYCHLYDAGLDEVLESYAGERETWGVAAAPCFRPGREYTHRHMLEDMQAVLEKLLPDTLVCSDEDAHADHLAVAALFDKAVANVQNGNASYRPIVLKTTSYALAWRGVRDFYAENMQASASSMPGFSKYAWDERLRLPVERGCCASLLSSHAGYHAFCFHASQQYPHYAPAERMFNGDCVFWWQPCGNVLLGAAVYSEASGGDSLVDGISVPYADVVRGLYEPGWAAGQTRARADIRLRRPARLAEIRLCKHPDSLGYEFGVQICATDTGPVEAVFPAGQRELVLHPPSCPVVQEFSLELVSRDGGHFGLTEVEAYAEQPQAPFTVAKLQDDAGNFMYDYVVPTDGRVRFSMYGWPTAPKDLRFEAVDVSGNVLLLEKLDDGTYVFRLPRGRSCTLYAYGAEGHVLDAARLENPCRFLRSVRGLVKRVDQYFSKLCPAAQLAYYVAAVDSLYCSWVVRRLKKG